MASLRKISQLDKKRIKEYLSIFACENSVIRAEIAGVIPMYNELLEMKALTFEEFALMSIAEKKGININDPLFSYKDIFPSCPSCEETEKIRKLEENVYICGRCKHRFAANHDSITTGTKCSSVIWLKVLHCMLNYYSVERICDSCGITANTYYAIRNRLFYAMQLMMEQVKLYGKIQCDNTFVRLNFKGADLSDPDYPENTMFDKEGYIPRSPRSRGGSYSNKEKNTNNACIFTAIDEYGHVFARYTGVGQATATRLVSSVESSKILHCVPDKDPFSYFKSIST